MYIPQLNQVYYFNTETKIGQIIVINLDLLIEVSPIKYAYYPDFQVINFTYEEQPQLLYFLDIKGNLNVYYYGGLTSDSTLPIDEFENNPPKNFSLDTLSNNIIIYNTKFAIQVNMCLISRGLTHYFDPLRTQFIIKYDNQGKQKYIISDSSSILYEYNNYSLIYSSYFDDKIIGLKQSFDQAVFIIYFQTYFLVFNYTSYNSNYTNNNYTYQVSGYRIYKFISDNIFQTHDFQIIHYNFKQNFLIKEINLPKDQTQKCILISKEKSLLFLGSSNGSLIIYNYDLFFYFSLKLKSSEGIIDILFVKEKFWIIQKDGILNIYPLIINEQSMADSILDLVSITNNSNQIDQTSIELNIIQVDELNSRYFVQFNRQKKLSIINIQTSKLIQNLSFPNDEYNRLKLTDKYIILYSIAQLNIHNRDNLYFAFQIRANNRRDEITDLQIINDSIFLISFLKRLDIYYVPNSTYSVLLVDSLTTDFPLVISAIYDKITTQLIVVGYSVTNLFDKKYWLKNFQNQQLACSSVIDGTTSIDFLRKLNIIQSTSSKRNQFFYINVFDMATINGIDQSKTQLIIKPQTYQEKGFSIDTNTFLLIKNDAYLKNFSFLFTTKGIYNFYEGTSQIFIEDAQIIEQNISGVQINFQNKQLIVINSLKIQNIYDQSTNKRIMDFSSSNVNEELNFLNFINCQSVYIYNLQLINVNIKFMKKIAYFSKINNLVIKNLTIQGCTFQIFGLFENIQNLLIEKIIIFKNNPIQLNLLNPCSLIIIQGCLKITIKQMNIQQNNDYQILLITNLYEKEQEQIHLKSDIVLIDNIISTNNKLQSKNLNQSFNQIVIEGTTILLNSVKFSENEMNVLIKNSKNFTIQNSNFSFNLNLIGGSIILKDINGLCQFINNIFTQNQAFASGGAIYADNIAELKIDNQTQIFKNTALIGGGIRIINSNTVLNISSNTIYNNKAEIYGNNIGTTPIDINIFSTQINQNNIKFSNKQTLNNLRSNNYYGNLIIDEYQSGSSTKLSINFIDIEGNKIQFSSEKVKDNSYPDVIINEIAQWTIQIESLDVNKIQITGESQVNYNQFDINTKSFTFNEIYLNSNPNSQQSLILKFQINNQLKRGEVNIDISFRQCILGEIYKKFSNTIFICSECTKGYYSIKIPELNSDNLNECQECPIEAYVCNKDKIILQDGYWKENNSDDIYVCDKLKNSCKEKDKGNIDGCIQGYVGPLCDQCDISGVVWNKRYSLSNSSSQCLECSSDAIQYFVILATAIGLLIYMLIQISIFIRSFSMFQTCYYLRLSNMIPISVSQMRNQNSFYVKCLINYLQLQSILVQIQIQNLPVIFIIPNLFGQPSSQIVTNYLCLVSQSIINNFGKGKTKIVIQSAIPFIYLIILLMIFFASERLNYKRFKVRSLYKYTALNFVFIFFQSESINTLTHFLTCRQIGSKSHISDDLLYECSDPSYVKFQNYFAIPLLIFWILIPSIVYFFIKKRANILNYCSTIFKFGYYCLEYHPNKYYWEFIRIYFKVTVVIFYTLFKQNKLTAHVIIIFLVSVYLSFLQKMQPFINPKMTKFEELSYLTIILIISISSLLDLYPILYLEYTYLLVNSSFILYIIWTIIQSKFLTKRSFVGKIVIFIIQKVIRKKNLIKFVEKMDVQFKTFVYWKKVRKNIHLLTNQKAIQRITQFLPNSYLNSNQDDIPDKEQKYLIQESLTQSKFKKNNSNFGFSILSLQKLSQNSLLYIPQQSEIQRNKYLKDQSKIDSNLQTHPKQIDKNVKNQQIDQDDQIEFLDINNEDFNMKLSPTTIQQMEFRTMLEKARNSHINTVNIDGLMTPKIEQDYLQSPHNYENEFLSNE